LSSVDARVAVEMNREDQIISVEEEETDMIRNTLARVVMGGL
jgi:hypothetical protein